MNGTHPLIKDNNFISCRLFLTITHVTSLKKKKKTIPFFLFVCFTLRALNVKALSHYSLDSIAQAPPTTFYNIASTRFYITATVANPPSSSLSWPPQQPSPSSTLFAASTVPPDHSSSAVGIVTPEYMLGLRNILLLPPLPPQITHPSPSSAVEDNKSVGDKVCRDCGNRAKKECLFERCRTCCKSRGYLCATHVKSTWVPSSHHRTATRSSSSSSSSDRRKNKKLRIDKHNPATNVLILPTTTSRQETSFKERLPGKIEAPAVFRRTRVTAISNNEQAEIGYQATVTISGHVFKGFLHYYGVDYNKAFPCLSNK